MPADSAIDHLLEGLNPPQRDAVTHGEGPMLILAGAGSGKTRVITHRIAYLLHTRQAQAGEILAITFTNKAAAEMRERVELLVGRATRAMWVMTFHAACARMLRAHADKLGFTRQFTIYDTADQRRLMKQCLDGRGYDTKRYTPRAMQSQISRAKNTLVSPERFAETAGTPFEEIVAEIYGDYDRELLRMNAMDFDDMLVNSVRLLERHQDVRDRYSNQFRWVMVDEYQDTNQVQYRWLQLLTSEHRNLAVVGDDAQCLVAGTPVTMADGSTKPIESVEAGDEVLSSYGSGDFRPARVTETFESLRPIGVEIVTEGGRRIVSTPEHTHFAGYVGALLPPKHLTYLMWRRDKGFRLGTTRELHTVDRANAAWVLSTHDTEAEARAAEQVYALEYTIATGPFDLASESTLNGAGDGERLLMDLHLDFQVPHHVPLSFEGRRRNVTLTLCGDRRGRRPMHTVAVGGRDEAVREQLVAAGFSVRPAKRGSQSWRYESCFRDFGRAVATVERIRSVIPATARPVARLGHKSLGFMPASSVRPGMAMFTEDGSFDLVESVERIPLDKPVYDINVEDTHNFIAGGLLTHNSIYSFRAADIRNILEFEEDYPDAHIVKLEQNYRSTQTILDAANALIAHNRGQMPKHLWTDLGEGDPVRVREMADEYAEARWVTAEIQRLVDEGVSRSEIAVFYRTNAQSRVLDEMLTRAGVAYQVIGGPKFYERAEVKDAIAYLTFLVNPQDATAFTRIANSPRRGIGQTSMSRVLGYAADVEVDVWDAARAEVPGLAKAAKNALRRFMDTMDTLKEKAAENGPVAQLLDAVLHQTGYLDALHAERTIEAQGRVENLQELLSAAAQFDVNAENGTLDEFLQQTSLFADADNIRDDEGLVTLMTMHNAKGLEFPIVFMIGMEDGTFPHSRSIEESNLEEERRLAYVGVTRAMRQLTLTYARRRMGYGGGSTPTIKSRFLDELPRELTDQPARLQRGFPAPGRVASWSQAAAATAENTNDAQVFSVGDDVIHAQLGEGVVTGLQPGGIVVVHFHGEGRDRSLMADVAPIRKR